MKRTGRQRASVVISDDDELDDEPESEEQPDVESEEQPASSQEGNTLWESVLDEIKGLRADVQTLSRRQKVARQKPRKTEAEAQPDQPPSDQPMDQPQPRPKSRARKISLRSLLG